MDGKKIAKDLHAVVEAGISPEHILSLCDNAANFIDEMYDTLDYARMIQADNIRMTAELAKTKALLEAATRDFKIIESYKNYPHENRPCAVCKNIGLYCSSGGSACKGFEWCGAEEVAK